MQLTIQPGLLFSTAAVDYLKIVGATDDSVARDLEHLERGVISPAEAVRDATERGTRGSRAYVQCLCLIVGISLVGAL